MYLNHFTLFSSSDIFNKIEILTAGRYHRKIERIKNMFIQHIL